MALCSRRTGVSSSKSYSTWTKALLVLLLCSILYLLFAQLHSSSADDSLQAPAAFRPRLRRSVVEAKLKLASGITTDSTESAKVTEVVDSIKADKLVSNFGPASPSVGLPVLGRPLKPLSACCDLSSMESLSDGMDQCDWFCEVGQAPAKYYYQQPTKPDVMCLKGLPKSGTTWLEYVVSYLLEFHCLADNQARKHLLHNVAVTSPGNCSFTIPQKRHYILEVTPDVLPANAPSKVIEGLKSQLKTKPRSLVVSWFDSRATPDCFKHGPISWHDSTIIILRDPRDTATSAIFYREALSASSFEGLSPQQKQQKFSQYQNKWLENVKLGAKYIDDIFKHLEKERQSSRIGTIPPLLIIKYESMRMDPYSAVQAIAKHLDLSDAVRAETFNEVLKATDFATLKQAELAGTMKIHGGKHDKSWGHGEKVRTGKISEYLELVSAEALERAEEIIREESEYAFQMYVKALAGSKSSNRAASVPITKPSIPTSDSPSSSSSSPMLQCLRGGQMISTAAGKKNVPINFLHILADDHHFRAVPWSIWGQSPAVQQEALLKASQHKPEASKIAARFQKREQNSVSAPSAAAGAGYAKGLLMPTLSKLANQGIIFENAHTAVPMDGQSRHALMTGIPFYAASSGREEVLRNAGDASSAAAEADADFTWLGKQLEPHFKVAFTGKVEGFPLDGNLNLYRHTFEGDRHYQSTPVRSSNHPSEREVIHSSPTEVFSDAAVHLLRHELSASSLNQKPFALFVHYSAPHEPRVPSPLSFKEEYRTNPDSTPLQPNFQVQSNVPGLDTLIQEKGYPRPLRESQWREETAGYFGLLTQMDQEIGKIIDQLRDDGRLESTVIVFQSDNGIQMGSHGLVGKQFMYEESLRIPMFISGACISNQLQQQQLPQRQLHSFAPSAARSHELVYMHDLHSTLLEWIGEDPGRRQRISGQSLLPAIEKSLNEVKGDHKAIVDLRANMFFSYGNPRSDTRTWFESVKSSDGYKLIVYPLLNDVAITTNGVRNSFRSGGKNVAAATGRVELYDLYSDPLEKHDLSKDFLHAPKMQQLVDALLAKREELTGVA